MEELKHFEELINNYQINEVNMNSILGIKKLADNFNDYEKQFLWKDFETKFNSIMYRFIELYIIVDSNIKYITDNNIILPEDIRDEDGWNNTFYFFDKKTFIKKYNVIKIDLIELSY